MTAYDDIPFGTSTPTVRLAQPRKCVHRWYTTSCTVDHGGQPCPDPLPIRCFRCGKPIDHDAAKRGRNNRKRGGSWEREAAADIGGRRMGQLNLPWDVEVPGYARIQTKQLAKWPSLNAVVEWLDAMGAGEELRGVALKGRGQKARRLVIFDWDSYVRWHGRK